MQESFWDSRELTVEQDRKGRHFLKLIIRESGTSRMRSLEKMNETHRKLEELREATNRIQVRRTSNHATNASVSPEEEDLFARNRFVDHVRRRSLAGWNPFISLRRRERGGRGIVMRDIEIEMRRFVGVDLAETLAERWSMVATEIHGGNFNGIVLRNVSMLGGIISDMAPQHATILDMHIDRTVIDGLDLTRMRRISGLRIDGAMIRGNGLRLRHDQMSQIELTRCKGKPTIVDHPRKRSNIVHSISENSVAEEAA